MSTELKPFLVRLTPTSVELLNKASKQLEKPKAVIINDAIKNYLSKDLGDLNDRLNKLGQ
jgi:predicted DNA-binding protein